MPGTSHESNGRMPLVEQLLELLRAGLPSFEFDEAAWRAQWVAARRGGPWSRRRENPSASARSPEEPVRSHGWSSRPRRVDPALAQCYARLEVAYGAGLAEIRAAWKRLVRQHHPDLHEADPERKLLEAEMIKEVNSSYEELKRRLKQRA